MNNVDIVFRRIQEVFSEFCRRQNCIENEKKENEDKYTKSISELDAAFEQTMNEISNIELRINGFLNIASAHTSHLIDDGTCQEYNSGDLSRLAVQINNASTSDKYAEELYTRAIAQLRGIQEKKSEIRKRLSVQKQMLERTFNIQKIRISKEETVLDSQITDFLTSEEFQKGIDLSLKDSHYYNNDLKNAINSCLTDNTISLGICKLPISIPKGYEQKVYNATNGLYNISSSTIAIPYTINVSSGMGVLIDYDQEHERFMLRGIQNLILNIIKIDKKRIPRITYIDPIRYNNSTLGALVSLSIGKKSIIDNVPLTIDEIRKTISNVLKEYIATEKVKYNEGCTSFEQRIIIIHGYPYSYDSTTLMQLQQLFVNAEHYNVIIIATHNISVKSGYSFDENIIRANANLISCDATGFFANSNDRQLSFEWYCSPGILPSEFLDSFKGINESNQTGNDYIQRVGLSLTEVRKGNRNLSDIPYGIDEEGNILTLDFENSNFAAFLCGAARSGKSTFLHTILTHIINHYHPDDVEIWLVDFKMTEFSRYINHLPPHIRYIILDESPELVYDLIDRLTEVLKKRQSIFMERWLKLKDVPIEKYMPAIFVIIDEFSIMSQIVSDSIISSLEDYTIKLQNLLAKGAALGFHFIFASQGFTDGSRGLTAFSKKQIQLRLAMKTDYVEIKETLDLKSTSDADRQMMEQLEPHYVLTKTTLDESGNHLKLANVLFISDYAQQERMIDLICQKFMPVRKYDVYDERGYIDKKTVVINGNEYKSFLSQEESIRAYINNNTDKDEKSDFVFIGEPKRLLPLYPIEIFNGFSENVLFIAPLNEIEPAISILLSITKSIGMCGKRVSLITSHRNSIYRKFPVSQIDNLSSEYRGVDEACCAIKHYKDLVANKIQGTEYIIVLGAESIIMDMSFLDPISTSSSHRGYNPLTDVDIEARNQDEPDILSLLDMAETGTVALEVGEDNDEFSAIASSPNEEPVLYDARDDLNYIITNGPRLGYHFVFAFNTIGEYSQCKIPASCFKHKITFRLSKNDAMELTGASKSSAIQNLLEHCFRYTNGLEYVSFRPYLHPSLSWDGWTMDGTDVKMTLADEDEYLL